MVERIKIKHPTAGWAGIHPSAFDPEKHERYEEAAAPFDGNEGELPDPLSREAIEAMTDKAAIIELIEAHGADPDGRRSVDTLRAQLIEMMFV